MVRMRYNWLFSKRKFTFKSDYLYNQRLNQFACKSTSNSCRVIDVSFSLFCSALPPLLDSDEVSVSYSDRPAVGAIWASKVEYRERSACHVTVFTLAPSPSVVFFLLGTKGALRLWRFCLSNKSSLKLTLDVFISNRSQYRQIF